MEAHEIQHVEVIVTTAFVLASEHEHLAIDHGGRMATPSRWHCATQLDERDPLVQAYIHTRERKSVNQSMSFSLAIEWRHESVASSSYSAGRCACH